MVCMSKNILLLSSNFCGNVGDLFIFESVCNFLLKNSGDVRIEVHPYPIRYDPFVALPTINKYEGRVEIVKPAFRIRKSIDHLMRRFHLVEKVVTNIYFCNYFNVFRVTRSLPFPGKHKYDQIIVVGGEMDAPFSLLDVHSYLNTFQVPVKRIIYGPISLNPKKHHEKFIRERFKEVQEFAVRDPLSLKKLNDIGINNNVLIPDCAFLSFDKNKFNIRVSTHKKIGLCLHSRWGHIVELKEFVSKISKACLEIGCEIVFFVTNVKEDYVLFNEMQKIISDFENIKIALPTTVEQLNTMYSTLDIVISDRLHGLLIGMLNGCVILPLATRQKVRGYCQYLNLNTNLNGNETQDELIAIISEIYNSIRFHREHLLCFMEEANKDVSTYYTDKLYASGLLKNENS